ncbi:MAG: hypothetical protein HC945_01135 [Nitrosarchaeum sp.]|nr:hypothetical protein [Nitrosarchaeum sp.]
MYVLTAEVALMFNRHGLLDNESAPYRKSRHKKQGAREEMLFEAGLRMLGMLRVSRTALLSALDAYETQGTPEQLDLVRSTQVRCEKDFIAAEETCSLLASLQGKA